jgi:RNA polymerase sigma-70 factor (ECF subfamily)
LEQLRQHPEDAEAWRRFDALYRPLLASWLRRHAIQDADREDLLQEILAAVVREMPTFEYDPARGRFRSWLRAILANRLRHYWRSRPAEGGYYQAVLDQLEDDHSSLARTWDQEHDRHVLARLLDLVRPEFEESTWQAFRLVTLESREVGAAAEQLRLSPNAVKLAKSRVLRRLRHEAEGLID